ncbi:MAG: PilZ domain-containing protein [Proteobacteria bacterium]|nr:PilZ domain-containing protein [Pseudomonadota bacterium]
MQADRRKSPRHGISAFAKIQYRADTLPRDCRLTDISDGGVRIHIEATDVPDEFLLLLGPARGGRRECRVVWRLGFEIGAEFANMNETAQATAAHMTRRA